MKVIAIAIALCSALVSGQTFAATIKECMTKAEPASGTPYVFCSPTDGVSTVATNTAITSGYCCLRGSTDPLCTENVECTLSKYDMDFPLFLSYWVGLTPEMCGATSRNFTATDQV